MKGISMFVAALGGAITLLGLLISAVAFTDAYYRCPGIQCSDAIHTGGIGAVLALLGLIFIGGAMFFWRRRG